jgi:dihydroorotate dehydrogenase
MYSYLKKFLFQLDPETAHQVTLRGLSLAHRAGLTRFFPDTVSAPRVVMGLTFTNPVGLAAGLDKNGDYVDALAALGFGFIEVGTVTPKPQLGNPAPRIFRLVKEEGIINRLGFNNKGCDYLVERLRQIKYTGILGVNIGKNATTPMAEAEADYLHCFKRVWPYASYVTINISSPNTKNLRDLQHGDALRSLLKTLKAEQKNISDQHNKYVPLALKLAPDLTREQVREISQIVLDEKIDAVIATNTTLGREGLNAASAAINGGLSGKPLFAPATEILRDLAANLQGRIPIIAAGGIMSADNAREKMAAGAVLMQLYSGLIYKGPGLVHEIAHELEKCQF